jgi:two-component system, cell cycle sensor histidine kinase and response regulator CckA
MNIIKRIPLTTKLVLLTVFVGLISWGMLEQVHNRNLKNIFETQLNMQLDIHAQEARVRFDNYVKSYRDAAEIIVSQGRFESYLAAKDLKTDGVDYHDEPPPWMPGRSVLRRLVRVSYAGLMDGNGNVREVYKGTHGPLPPTLLKPDSLLRAMSFNQSLTTKVDGIPFVLTAKPVLSTNESTRAILMLASPLDNDFLADSQGFAGGRGIIVLISDDKIIASNRPDFLAPGTPLDEAKRNYLMIGKSFFDTGSDLLIEFASLMSRAEYDALGEEILATGRRNRLLLALTFIVIFSLVMSRITRRIENLTTRISDFSEKNLGGIPQGAAKGDQLSILDMSFQRLTEKVVSVTERLSHARDELEFRVEERTRELKESENKFRDLAERSLVGVYLIQDDLFRYVNPEFAALFGYTVEELTGRMGPADLAAPEDWPLVEQQLMHRLGGVTESVHYVFRGVKKNLAPVDVEVYGSRTSYHGKPAVIGTLIDITERKKAEEEIRGLFSILNTLVEHMPEGVILLDDEDRIILANPVGAEHMEALSGARKGDILENLGGRAIRDLLVSPPLIMWHDLTTEQKIYEVAGRKIDSRGLVFVIREVTEERLLKERVQLHERLAAIGQVSAGVAHDFNNILTVMSGYAEMLLERDLPGDMKRQVEAIHLGGERASMLISQILDLSRKTVGELRPLEMAGFTDEFIRFIERTIPENISIKFRHLPGEYIVNADRTKMEQVLANLVVNARDAMSEGGELILDVGKSSIKPGEKRPLPEMPPGDWITLRVEDTGAGIPAEVLPHIFEPFYTTKAGRGTGLGLSQVYGIVRQHKGFIDVKTAVGKGSTFTIYLPAVGEAIGLLRQEKIEAALRGRGETLLIVEDERSVLEYVRTALSNLGYRILTAENGVDALKLFEAHENDIRLLITDMVMPEMGGARLAIEIHRRKPGLRVIALSAYSPVTDQEFQEAGFENFIKKPFKLNSLADAIRKALDKPVTTAG